MNKNVLLVIAVAIFIAAALILVVSDSIRIGDVLNSMGNLSPRVLGLALLPFMVAFVIVGIQLHKKKEERMWKEALKRTRAKKQQEEEAARNATQDQQP